MTIVSNLRWLSNKRSQHGGDRGPVFGLGFAALLLGEPVGRRTAVAAVLVVSGVLLTQRAPRISPQIAAIGATRTLPGEASAG